MDVVVLYWLTNMITTDLQVVVWERGRSARHLWLAQENEFLSNHETRTLHLDAIFRNFVQGDFSVTEYCRKFKGMADALADLGSPVDDRILILDILHDLNQCFKHLGAIIRCSSSFPNFLKIRDDLLLEDLDIVGPSTAPTALYTSTAPLAPKSQPATPSRPPNSNNNRNKNNNHRNGGRNNSSDGGRGGNYGNTTASIGSTSNDSRATSPWPTYVNPW
jgi:hypothetical protein